MSMLNAPHAKVVRDGKVQQVASEDLVLDDIVIFSAGIRSVQMQSCLPERCR